jgi:hypothetical protein
MSMEMHISATSDCRASWRVALVTFDDISTNMNNGKIDFSGLALISFFSNDAAS